MTASWRILCAGAAWLASGMAQANDTSISSEPGRVRILKNHRIVMQSERIQMSFVGPCSTPLSKASSSAWEVEAHYVFVNPGSSSQKVRLGFPEALCSPEFGGCVGGDPTFRDMVTTVRGVPVDTQVQLQKRGEPYPVGRIWAYGVTFRPKERVDIVHRFAVTGMVDVAGARGLSYLVGTGNNWAKPIGSAQFVYRLPSYVSNFRHLPDEPWGDGTRSGLSATSSRYLVEDGQSMLELVYSATDWTPQGANVDIDFETGCLGSAGLSLPRDLFDPKARAQALGQPNRYCAWDDFKNGYNPSGSDGALVKSPSDLEICIHAVHALRGQPFKDPYLQRYFYEGQATDKRPPYPAFWSNPSYSDAMLVPIDRQAIRRFEAAIASRRGSSLAPAGAANHRMPAEARAGGGGAEPASPSANPDGAVSAKASSKRMTPDAKQAGVPAAPHVRHQPRSWWRCALAPAPWWGPWPWMGLWALSFVRRSKAR